MTIEDLKNHCEKQIDLCSKLNDYKHLEEHQLILNLIKENQNLKEKLNKYENPDDMTLMYMWCDEKLKDDNKKLQERVNYLERSNNRREDIILEQRQQIEN